MAPAKPMSQPMPSMLAPERPPPLVLESALTCPACGHASMEIMPTDACQFFYECKQCKAVLRPLDGDCCVFCSYGSVKCPPVQMQRGSACCGE